MAYEEKDDQLLQPDQIERYLGEGHGIQGHQNSCYLDATVFGLFALNDTFDKMFLGEAGGQTRQEISYILWKGIVNTLRKLVSCSCVCVCVCIEFDNVLCSGMAL